MNEARVNAIRKNFEGIGTEETVQYTNQEIVDKLMELQSTMANGVFERTHAEHMRDRDVMKHFSNLAKEYGLKDTVRFRRFKENVKEMSFTIATFIKGMNGEKLAKKALKLMSYEKNVKILYNIALEDEDMKSEYDAIVVAPYGLFVIEVKNWAGQLHIDENGILEGGVQVQRYDLPGRMSVKECLLREYLGDKMPEKFQGIILFANENAKVQDDYKLLPVYCGGGIAYKLRSYNTGENLLSAKQVQEICDVLENSHKEQRTTCKVNCQEIIEDYAVLMAAMEEAADGMPDSVEELLKEGQAEAEEEAGIAEAQVASLEETVAAKVQAEGPEETKVVAGVAEMLGKIKTIQTRTVKFGRGGGVQKQAVKSGRNGESQEPALTVLAAWAAALGAGMVAARALAKNRKGTLM